MHITLRSIAPAPAAVALRIPTPAPAPEGGYEPSGITAFVATGAGTDNFTRTVQPVLEARLDTSVTVSNLPSASGALAHQRTAPRASRPAKRATSPARPSSPAAPRGGTRSASNS